ncbi:MAG: glutamyl-tRNA reductase [Bacteroidales bacterium]|nr:glutamyl-tRNA reductase [Bacteroidales bacterium]
MHFIVIGINHKTAGIALREKIFFPGDKLSDAYKMLNNYSSVKGSMILSTCNRTEIYGSVEKIEEGFNDIEKFISDFCKIPVEKFSAFIYKKNCRFAVSHLFKVASGLDSMVIGEYQVQGQVRDAYFTAKENNSANGMINKLFQTAIQIGKKVRSETEIGSGSVSIATLAVELIKQIFEHKNNFNVLIIGAGKISSLTISNLQKLKSCKITIANRSEEKALELAKNFNGKVIDFEKRYEAITENDIIIVSTSADKYVICKNELMKTNEATKNKIKVFIDLSVPRNVDPEINTLENHLVYSIDDINKLVTSNLNKRTNEMGKAEKIIEEISEDYYDWYSKQFIIPTMFEIKKELETLKQRTLSSYKTQLDALDKKQKEIIGEMLDSYSDKLIKVIMKNIKNSTTKEDLISITKTLKDTFTIEINDN